MADSREQFLQDTDAAIQAEPLTVALSLLNNTPGTLNGRGSTYIFRAVGDIEVTDSVELSTEPGVMGRIGPKFPRSASFRVRVHDNPTTKVDPKTGLFTPETARAQHNLLRNLVGTLMYIDARAAPPERIIWTIENVKAIDDNSAKNAYDVDVSAREILGGEFGEFIDPNELSSDSGRVPLQGDGALGLGTVSCEVASTAFIGVDSVPRGTDEHRHNVWPPYTGHHGTTTPLLPDWMDYLRGLRSGPFIEVSNAHIQTRAFLRGLLPPYCEIVSIETVNRPNMASRTYACQHLSLTPGAITLSFEKTERGESFTVDVGIHAAGDATSAPLVSSNPPAPIYMPDVFDPTINLAIIFVGDPWDDEEYLSIGRLMVIIRGNFLA